MVAAGYSAAALRSMSTDAEAAAAMFIGPADWPSAISISTAVSSGISLVAAGTVVHARILQALRAALRKGFFPKKYTCASDLLPDARTKGPVCPQNFPLGRACIVNASLPAFGYIDRYRKESE